MKFKIISFKDKEIFEETLANFCDKTIVLNIKYSTSSNRYDEITHSAMVTFKPLCSDDNK